MQNTDHMLFMKNESIHFCNGKGDEEEAKYVGPIKIDGVMKHRIVRSNDSELMVDREHLYSINLPDVSGVPVTIEQFASEIPKLTREQVNQIANPSILDSNQWDLLLHHCRMNHLPFPSLIKLAEAGVIPKKLAKLKNRLPVCMSCMFGTAHKRPWRTKGKPGTIRKDDEDAPGKCVSIDQMVSAQPGLIPQMTGFLTNLWIWGQQSLSTTSLTMCTWP